jgi:1-phosphofructokinase family hexose kinase
LIHLVTLNPALDLFFDLEKPSFGKIGKVINAKVEPGGKALNVARFLKKLKTPSIVWLGTGGGSDPTHVLYRSLLAKEKLKAFFLSRKTPIRLNLVTQTHRESHKYNHPGFETDLNGFSRLLSKVQKNDTMVLTGRLPKGVNDSLYASWVETFNRKGIKTVVDTSGKSLLHAVKAKPWFFKSNLFEISEALGQKIKNLKQAQVLVKKNWLKNSFRHGALTDGSSGAILWKDQECYLVQTPKVAAALVVGAGDGFLAGYLYGLRKGKGLKEAAAWAAAFGVTVAARGIQGFDRTEAGRFYKKVKVRRVL